MRIFVKSGGAKSALLPAIVCACAIAFLLFWGRFGEAISFDALVWFRGPTPHEAVVVTMDETAYSDTTLNEGYEYPKFNRATHAILLEKLKGAKVVVFDLFFKESQPEDSKLAEAITNHGNVVIVCETTSFGPRFPGGATNDPVKPFDDLPGCSIALPLADKDVMRMFPPDTEYRQSVARATAEKWGVRLDGFYKPERWVKFYGDRDGLITEPYRHAMDHPDGYYEGKAVFIGGKPNIKLISEASDEFGTPWTRWSGNKMRGVEILATMFLNLIHNDWLTRMSIRNEIIFILLVGIIFGWVFTLFRPVPGLILVPIGVAAVSFGAIALLWTQRVWFNWLVIGWIEIPLAWATSAVIYSRVLFREKQSLLKEKESLQDEIDSLKSVHPSPATMVLLRPQVSAADALAKVLAKTITDGPVVIEQYRLLKRIGEGAFGQVWLATDLVGTYCAIKIIFRKNFSDARPFLREFEGVRNFKAISGRHVGWVPILHIGKDDNAGFFYYVMELADDLETGQNIDPEKYTPKTLGKLLVEKSYLPVEECIRLGVDLADALAALHAHHLVHRDIKPSNIIFANNRSRLADIGLVTRMDNQGSFVGTEGFIPQEGPGTPVADIFSLGRVLYMASTGAPPDLHPELPSSLNARSDVADLMRLMEIINKACARFHGDRYQSAAELHDDLVKLRLHFGEDRT